MGRIENYDNDSGISNQDRLFGTSYEGIVDGKPVYKTKNYLMGEVISKVVSEVESAGDRWDVISYKFTPQMIYDLGDAGSGVLDLDPSSSGNYKNWVLLPGVANKNIVVSNALVYVKRGATDFDANYTINLAMFNAGYTGYPGNLTYELSISLNIYEADYYKSAGGLFSGYNCLVGKPLMLSVQNSTVMTEGDGELGIWIEYKYLDFNTDF
jgi:hypothetical protein